MSPMASVFYGIAMLVLLIQDSHAISRKEYMERISKIKSNPDVRQFLIDNQFAVSHYGVLFEKLANLFVHFHKTEEGSQTLKHIWDQTQIVLDKPGTFDFFNNITTAFKKVFTSEVGVKNLISMMKLIQSELQIPNLLKMSLTLEKMMFYLLLSENGLKSWIATKEHNLKLSTSEDTAPLMKILNEEFPIIPPADTKASEKSINAEKLKSLASKLSFNRTLSN